MALSKMRQMVRASTYSLCAEFTHCYETRTELAHGGLLIMDNFGLQDAMSAIEVRTLNFCATLWLRSG